MSYRKQYYALYLFDTKWVVVWNHLCYNVVSPEIVNICDLHVIMKLAYEYISC